MSETALKMTVDDLQNAENAIFVYVQHHSFPEELKALRVGELCMRKSSLIYRLDPILVDGLLRVGGRIKRAELVSDAKHPIILPKDSRVSNLIVEDIHRSLGHMGKNSILNKLQQRFWILRANSVIKKVVSKCVTCRLHRAKVGEQKMANLHLNRLVANEPPFTRSGIDYFGLIEVKRKRSMIKRYGVVFTCLTSRAIHLEVASSLNTDSCINAFRRFVSRRGQVKVMRSDNGTNLVGAVREMREEIEKWNRTKIHDFLCQKNIRWEFNPPGGSHFGGVWERQIRTIRKILFALLREQSVPLDDEMLHTLLCEIEAVVNSRPITSMSDDPNDLEALTPNHLLLLRARGEFPPGTFCEDDIYCRRRWRQVQYLTDGFWKRWTREFLPSLQVRSKWSRVRRNLVPGDIVLIVDKSAPRCSWLMGRVIEVAADCKGLVRSAKVKTKTAILERPVDKLCLIVEATDPAFEV